jgi:hypothetical protein
VTAVKRTLIILDLPKTLLSRNFFFKGVKGEVLVKKKVTKW